MSDQPLDGTTVTKPHFDVVERTYGQESQANLPQFMYSDDLEELERGIRQAEKLNSAVWYMEAIAVFRIFDDLLFTQSGLDKKDYEDKAKDRLGMDRRRLSDAYHSGAFLVKHHAKLIEKGWEPEGQARKMAYADRALRRYDNDVDLVVDHLMNDSKEEFEAFAQGKDRYERTYKPDVQPRDDIEIKTNKVYIGGVEAITIGDLPKEEKAPVWSAVKKLAKAMQEGYYPEIVYCYDQKEARRVQNLLKKDRQSR